MPDHHIMVQRIRIRIRDGTRQHHDVIETCLTEIDALEQRIDQPSASNGARTLRSAILGLAHHVHAR